MQRSPNNKFDQQVKKTLENASAEPPAFLWNTIENKLPSNDTWYSKYKYLMLLLLLSVTSATSIFVYKNIVQESDVSTIALNKRLLKDETVSHDEKVKVATENLSDKTTAEDNTSAKNNSTEVSENTTNNNKSTVASFYAKDKNDKETAASLFAKEQAIAEAKRAARLKRLEVKAENNEVGINNQDENSSVNENDLGTASLTSSKKLKSKKISKSNVDDNKDASFNQNSTDENLALAQNEKSVENKSDNSLSNSTAQQISNSLIEEDVTTPISEPIRRTETEPLTASTVPVKVQQAPLASRDVLRSMIEPGKLETLDIKDQAIGINEMNPEKEKMLKNLKQFSGYDINKGFHFGAFININNVWLNKKQFSADENTMSIKPKVQFGKSYGVNIGYDYTDRWGIQMEWQISEQGQKYKVGQKDGYHTKDINLLYTKFPLMVKYKQTFINNYNSKPIALSFVFGPQIGFLIKKDVTLDGNKVNNVPEYNKVEFGVLGGFDFDLFMTRNVALTIGARSGFASSMRIGQPMSFQLGVTTQFNFRFPKKIK